MHNIGWGCAEILPHENYLEAGGVSIPIALHCGSFIFNMAVKHQKSADFD